MTVGKLILFRRWRRKPVIPLKNAVVRILLLIALGIGNLLFPMPWRFLTWVLTIGYVALWVTNAHRRKFVSIARRLRHRQANQLQILTGWVQLNDETRAQTQLDQMIEQTGRYGALLQGLPTNVSYTFIWLDAVAEARAVTIVWHGLKSLRKNWPKRGMLRVWRLRRGVLRAIEAADQSVEVFIKPEGFIIRVVARRAPNAQWFGPRWYQGEDGEWTTAWPSHRLYRYGEHVSKGLE